MCPPMSHSPGTAQSTRRLPSTTGSPPPSEAHRDSCSISSAAGLPAFEAEVKRLFGNHAQIQAGSDDSVAAASARRGTSLQALALVLFGRVVALAMLVIVAQSITRPAH